MNEDPASLAWLHDVVSPGPVNFWPPAPGWWLLAALVLLAFAAAVVEWLRRRKANRYRREALAELARLEGALRAGGVGRGEQLANLAELVRRTALSAYPREEVAGLAGRAWLEFLDARSGSRDFTAGSGRALAEVAYAREPALSDGDLRGLCAAIRRWIARHAAEPRPA